MEAGILGWLEFHTWNEEVGQILVELYNFHLFRVIGQYTVASSSTSSFGGERARPLDFGSEIMTQDFLCIMRYVVLSEVKRIGITDPLAPIRLFDCLCP